MKPYRSPTRSVFRGLLRSIMSNYHLSKDDAIKMLKDYALRSPL